MGKSASRGRARPGEMQMPPRIIKSVSIQNDVKALHQSEKPWKPTPKQIAAGEISNKVSVQGRGKNILMLYFESKVK